MVLVDADLGLANVDVQLGFQPARDLAAVIAGAVPAEDAAIAHPAGFDILAGRSGSLLSRTSARAMVPSPRA